jgi:hypothetical protein
MTGFGMLSSECGIPNAESGCYWANDGRSESKKRLPVVFSGWVALCAMGFAVF